MCARRLIAVDVGNSALKAGLFVLDEDGEVGQPKSVVRLEVVDDLDLLRRQLSQSSHRWCVVSVNRSDEGRLAGWVQDLRPQDDYVRLTRERLPLTCNVQFPERVGVDRLVSAVAVNTVRPAGQSAIIVDAGTAITVDLVDGEGVFQGGAILPGLRTAALGLASSTDALPLVDPLEGDDPPLIGKSTELAIRSGVVWGTVGAVKELISRFRREQDDDAEVYCTGGQGAFLARVLGCPLRFDPHLVLRGAAIAGRKV